MANERWYWKRCSWELIEKATGKVSCWGYGKYICKDKNDMPTFAKNVEIRVRRDCPTCTEETHQFEIKIKNPKRIVLEITKIDSLV